MAQQAKATREAVFAACERIAARGEAVTLQSVRQEIGGGSLGTIQPLLKEWRAAQDQAARDQAAQAAPEAEEPPALPLRVGQALDAGRQAFDGVAAAVVEAINTAVADERRRGRLELDTERESWERRLAAAQDQVKAAEEETAAVAADAADIEARADRLAEALAVAEAELARLTGELAGEREAHQAVQATAEALQQTVKQAEARAEAAEKRAGMAEAAQAQVEQAHMAADAERRQVIAQAQAREEKEAERIAGLTAERDQARQELAAAKAVGEVTKGALDREREVSRHLQTQVTGLEAAKAEALAAAAERSEQIAGLTGDLVKTRQALAAAQAEAAEAKGRLGEQGEGPPAKPRKS